MVFRRRPMPVASLPAGRRVYAIGDIHGEADLLVQLLHAIREDSLARGSTAVTLVFLGDFIDRGREAATMLKVMYNAPEADVMVLKGNHEAALVDVYRGDEEALAFWLKFGGRPTLEGLGVAVPDGVPIDTGDILARLRLALEPHVIDWLDALPHSWTLGDYFFAHAGIRPRVRLSRQNPDDLLWIREPFLSSQRNHGKVVVHGHTIEPGRPPLGGNRIGIDTGAHENGCLTALGLEGNLQWLIQVVDGRDAQTSEEFG